MSYVINRVISSQNWQQKLKNIADIYKRIKVLFTGSSMIDIIHSKFDLSRRVTLHYLGGLSFREYCEFSLTKNIEPIKFEDLLKKHVDYASSIDIKQILKHFRQYLQMGYYLFFKNLPKEYDRLQAITILRKKLFMGILLYYII